MTVFADITLARQLEGMCAAEMERFVLTSRALDTTSTAQALEVGGGIAVFVAPGSPVNRAFGLGMHGPITDGEIAGVEEFFLARDTHPIVSVCPLSHPSVLEVLGARGWVADGFENVLCRELDSGDAHHVESTEGIEIREAVSEEERQEWRLVAAVAFCAPLPPLDEQLALGEIIVHRPGTRLFTAMVDGRPAGTGELFMEDGVAWLSADATLPQSRRRGVQGALQRHRLGLAARAGCRLAATESTPGGPSQRNMERAGFRVAYTRVDMVLPGES